MVWFLSSRIKPWFRVFKTSSCDFVLVNERLFRSDYDICNYLSMQLLVVYKRSAKQVNDPNEIRCEVQEAHIFS